MLPILASDSSRNYLLFIVTGSVQPRNVQHFSHLQEFRPYQESTPLQSRLTPKNYGQNLQSHQDAILNAREGM